MELARSTGRITGGLLRRALPLVGAALDIILPPVCPLCEEDTADGPLCAGCLERFESERLSGPLCTICGTVFPPGTGPDRTCGACMKKAPPFELARSVFAFEGAVLEGVHALKYSLRSPAARPLGELLASRALALSERPGVVVPVPLHPRKLRKRGFNQALLLSRVVARRMGASLDYEGLERYVDTPPQVGLKAAERGGNVAGAFRVRDPGRFRDALVLLVDDVYTTGATVSECARVLGKAGARVFVLTLARAL